MSQPLPASDGGRTFLACHVEGFHCVRIWKEPGILSGPDDMGVPENPSLGSASLASVNSPSGPLVYINQPLSSNLKYLSL